MPPLVWDEPGARVYETGVDRGVLFLQDGSGIAWNGITEVEESPEIETEPVYYDGIKISELQEIGAFSGKLKAFTYPDEFAEFDGTAELNTGVFLHDQFRKPFSFSYRTRVGNDIDGAEASYKIHIIYNVIAVPSDKSYPTVGDDIEAIEFEWELYSIPEEVVGYRPSSHITINTKDLDIWLLEDINGMLYGSDETYPILPPIKDLVELLDNWAELAIIDHGDGTWSAVEAHPGFISFDGVDPDLFTIVNANAQYYDDDFYEIVSSNENLSSG